MYLYNNGQKYECLPCKPRASSKMAALIELLDAYNDLKMQLPLELAFLRNNPLPGVRIPVHVGRWEYLESVYTTEVNGISTGIQEKTRTSPTIFKEVYKFVDELPWIYTYEDGYKEFITRLVPKKFTMTNGEEAESILLTTRIAPKMILVPDLFPDYNTETYISEDM